MPTWQRTARMQRSDMRTNVSSKTATVWLAMALTLPVFAADKKTDERDWLFSRQIELYNYLLRGVEVANPLHEQLQGGFHRFAFEYWLLFRTDAEAASPWWR